MKGRSMMTIHKAIFVTVGYGFLLLLLLLLSTPVNGFSIFRTTHRRTSTAGRSACSGNTNAQGSDGNNNSVVEDDQKKSIGSSRRSMMIRDVLPVAALFASAVVSNPGVASAGIDVSGLRVEGTPKLNSPPPPSPSSSNNNDNNKGTIELAGVQYTQAAMLLQMAEQTASMEGMMKASASDVQGKRSRQERVEAGSQGKGPGVVARGDLTQSVGIMVKNSKIATFAPRAAIILQGIPEYLSNKSPGTDMTFDEYLTVAKKYEEAREDLRIVFEKMSEEDQQEGKKITRAIRKRDMERMAAMQQ